MNFNMKDPRLGGRKRRTMRGESKRTIVLLEEENEEL